MVARDQKLELRRELEVITVHEIGTQLFAAGHLLDPRLGPALPSFGLRNEDKTGGAQPGQFTQVTRLSAAAECICSGGCRVVAQDPGQCLQKNRLAVCT